MDRLLSEFVLTAKTAATERYLDLPDRKTLEHHAEDMIGAGTRTLELLGSGVPGYLIEGIERE